MRKDLFFIFKKIPLKAVVMRYIIAHNLYFHNRSIVFMIVIKIFKE